MKERIFVTSDLHLCHNKEFLWGNRGFSSIEEMNETIVARWNEVVGENDVVWVLGDLILNDMKKGLTLLSRLNGRISIVVGNHDTNAKVELYRKLGYRVEYGMRLRYRKYNFFLSHYPMITYNANKGLKKCVINLHGHTHQTFNFTEGYDLMYHVGVDSHNFTPVLLDDIIEEMKERHEEK